MKKIPERKCVCCGEMKPRNELLRIVKAKDGGYALIKSDAALRDAVRIGEDGALQGEPFTGRHIDGRSAYVCLTEACAGMTVKKRMLSRSFKQGVPEAVYTQVEALLQKGR